MLTLGASTGPADESRSASGRRWSASFPEPFDRIVTACARSQRQVGRSARTLHRARASRALRPSRAASPRLRWSAAELRDAWADADAIHSVLRAEVARVARGMRVAGIDARAALWAVRAHIRFVLYDGGLTEEDTEPVVQRASLWVEQVYAP